MSDPLREAARRVNRRQAIGILAAPLALPLLNCVDTVGPDARPMTAFSDEAPVILIGAGDPHAKGSNANATSVGLLLTQLLDTHPSARAFALGDLTANGTAAEFQNYDQAWGAFKHRTNFQLGNHDLLFDKAGGPYYDYVGVEAGARGKGYYARTDGRWRGYYLNSMQNIAEQTAWLAADLPQWVGYRIYAMWHHPMFASVCANNGRTMAFPARVGPWWQLLQQHGAEFVVTGHVHRYERFPHMLQTGVVDPAGLRQFTVGTGGVKQMAVLTAHPQSELRITGRGALSFFLYADRYEWTWTDIDRVVRDSGVQNCRIVAPV